MFKTQIAQDLENVFFNQNEFAEIHNLNGIELSCVIDDAINQERSYQRSESFNDGLVEFDLQVIFKSTDYAYELVQGQQAVFDAERYLVSSCGKDSGATTLKLQKVAG